MSILPTQIVRARDTELLALGNIANGRIVLTTHVSSQIPLPFHTRISCDGTGFDQEL